MPEYGDSGSVTVRDGILTVTQLNMLTKGIIDANPLLGKVAIRGEISNLSTPSSGHIYFTLKDERSVLRAVMFRSSTQRLRFAPEDGMTVVARGGISVYMQGGSYQLYVSSLEPDGLGALYIAYEKLRRRLEAEGLFDAERKRPLPKIPRTVGIITSPTGAAVRDMINVIGRRFPHAEIVLFPSPVQGEGAAERLCEGIEYFSDSLRADVVIIGRGGGSIEDLWEFNNEKLARTIAACRVPVISAVGHETDFTIADFAADRRAPTPSAAAELAVPETRELKRKIENVIGRLSQLINADVLRYRALIDSYAHSRALMKPAAITDERRMRLLLSEQLLCGAMKDKVSSARADFAALTSGLSALDPLAVLARGYSAVFAPDGRVIKSVEDVSEGDEFTLRTSDGEIDATVRAARKKKLSRSGQERR